MVTLKEDDKAPVFTGNDQDGNTISLTNYKGKKLILYFYSEAGSPTCTLESCNLRDHFADLKKNGFEVLGVSPDNEQRQKKFASKYKLPFTLVADVDNKIADLYGVYDQKKLFGHEYMGILRTTFIIDEKGIIRKIFHKPKNKAHAQEILKAWNEE